MMMKGLRLMMVMMMKGLRLMMVMMKGLRLADDGDDDERATDDVDERAHAPYCLM